MSDSKANKELAKGKREEGSKSDSGSLTIFLSRYLSAFFNSKYKQEQYATVNPLLG